VTQGALDRASTPDEERLKANHMNSLISWRAPTATTALAVIVFGPFGPGWRNFGVAMFSYLFLGPAALVLLVGATLWVRLERRPQAARAARTAFLAILVPLLLAAGLLYSHDPVRDPVRYAVWAAFHQHKLAAARRRDGIFKHWDSWGAFVFEDDSYLASDPTDTLARPGQAERWGRDHHLTCKFDVQRLARGIFLLTTYDYCFDQNIQALSAAPGRTPLG